MSKKPDPATFRVLIQPSTGMLFFAPMTEEQRARKICEAIIANVKRHVDDIESVTIDYDDVCEHCGARWTERDRHYNGGCCDVDQSEEETRKARLTPPQG